MYYLLGFSKKEKAKTLIESKGKIDKGKIRTLVGWWVVELHVYDLDPNKDELIKKSITELEKQRSKIFNINGGYDD